MKQCCRCKKLKQETEFWIDKRAKDGFDSACKECREPVRKAYYHRMKNKYPEKMREKAREGSARWRKKNPERNKQLGREFHKREKLMVFEKYGINGIKCACCGEIEFKFLCIDHIDGCGKEKRKIQGGGPKLYHWLKKNNYPKGFQILCHNCNMAKGFYGECPHKQRSELNN